MAKTDVPQKDIGLRKCKPQICPTTRAIPLGAKYWMDTARYNLSNNHRGIGRGSNWSKLDVRELHCCISLIFLHIRGHAGVGAAGTTVGSWLSAVGGVGAVQPEHVCIVVIPQGHDKDHACVDGLLHGIQSSLLQKVRTILSGRDPVTAKVIGDAIMGLAIDCVCRVLNGLAVLFVELPHLHEFAMIGAIVCDELRGHRDRLSAINLEVGARTEEIVRAQPVRLDVAAVLVAHAAENDPHRCHHNQRHCSESALQGNTSASCMPLTFCWPPKCQFLCSSFRTFQCLRFCRCRLAPSPPCWPRR